MDYSGYALSVSLFVSSVSVFSMYIRYLEKKQKMDIQAERQARQDEAELVLTKTRMYTDRDIRTSMIEAQSLSSLEPPQIPQDMSLDSIVPFLAQNPDLVKGFIEKIKK